jgi:hypothetical protein
MTDLAQLGFRSNLADHVRNPDARMRAAAAAFLGVLPDPQLSAILGQALLDERDPDASAAFVRALKRRVDEGASRWLHRAAVLHAEESTRILARQAIVRPGN